MPTRLSLSYLIVRLSEIARLIKMKDSLLIRSGWVRTVMQPHLK